MDVQSTSSGYRNLLMEFLAALLGYDGDVFTKTNNTR